MKVESRIVAISHGNKKKAPDMLDDAAEAGSDEGSPTIVHIRSGEETVVIELEDDNLELLFLTGLYPMSWRSLREGEDINTFHEVHTRKVRRGGKSIVEVVDEVGGIQAGDIVLTPLGGSGPELQHALTKRITALNEANGTNGRMFRSPWFRLHDQIKARELDGEPRVHAPKVLIEMYLSSINTDQFKQWFYEPTESDRSVMLLVDRRPSPASPYHDRQPYVRTLSRTSVCGYGNCACRLHDQGRSGEEDQKLCLISSTRCN